MFGRGPEKFRFWGSIDLGAYSWKSQMSRWAGRIVTGQVGIGEVRRGRVGSSQIMTGQGGKRQGRKKEYFP